MTIDPLVDHVIEGKYRLISRLGAGGMGSVYRAERLLIGDQTAIKILHAEHMTQPESFERFRREAQAAARLKHPNAVSIYDFGVTSDGLVYLVMELVEGQTLRQVIKTQGPLTATAAVEIIEQVCSALDEAHQRQIVHRDLKPDNIIINNTSRGLRAKVLDFGIAKLIVIPVLNPDGLEAQSRTNDSGVDINRNFPARNWESGSKQARYYPGKKASSEPETRAMIELIKNLSPILIISVHAPLYCVNWDGPGQKIAEAMAEANRYPLCKDIGYSTPGSLGSYAGKDLNIPVITLELREARSSDKLIDEGVAALRAAIKWLAVN